MCHLIHVQISIIYFKVKLYVKFKIFLSLKCLNQELISKKNLKIQN